MANKTINSVYVGSGDIGVFALPYGECSTAAATAAKTVTVQGDFVLEKGAMVVVKFTNANSVASPTLNVTPKGGTATGAKPITRYGTTAASTGTTTTGWRAGAVQIFIYDGTSWVRDFWENTTYSNLALGQGYGVCSTAAATAAKTVSITSYALTTGGIVAIRFTNGNTVANPTLNINSKGARAIFYNGAALTDTTLIKAGDTVTMMYWDGGDTAAENYHILAIDKTANYANHKHSVSGNTGSTTPTFTGSAATSGKNSGTGIAVSTTSHTHSIPALTFTGTTAGHTHTWSDTSDGPSKTTTVPSTSHTHSIPEHTTGGPSGTTSVGSSTHTHSIPELKFTGTGFAHTHSIPEHTTGANSGTAFSAAPSGHTHGVSGTSGAASTSTGHTYDAAAKTHNHSFTGTAVTSGANSGTAGSVAPSGHTHSVTPTVSVSISSQRYVVTFPAVTSGANSGTAFSAAPSGHTHSVTASGTIGNNTSGATVSTPSHTHSVSITSGANSGTAGSVAPSGHTHTTSAKTTGSTTHTPEGSITVGTGDSIGNTGTPSATSSVASSGHTHTTSAKTSGAVSTSTSGHTVSVASSDHTHSVSGTTSSTDITPAGTIGTGTTGAASTSSGHTGTAAPNEHTHSVTAKGSVGAHTHSVSITTGTPT